MESWCNFSVLFCSALLSLTACSSANAIANVCPKHCYCDSATDKVVCRSEIVNNFTSLLSDLPKHVRNLTVIESSITHLIGKHINVSKYPSLISLSIINGYLEEITTGVLDKVPKLRFLNLSSNALQTLQADVFLGLGCLKELDLSHNVIDLLPKSAFMFLQDLEVLNLKHNNLVHIPAGIFNGLNKLKSLDLSFNKLNFIEKLILVPLQSIKSIDLTNNNMTSMTSDYLSGLSQLEALRLSSNPWDCSCALEWMPDSKIIPDFSDMRCSTPEAEASKLISDAKLHKCTHPVIHYISQSSTVRYHGGVLLHCNATGYPKPSIYWIGPRGTILAHRLQRHWLVNESQDSVTFESHPVMFSSTAHTLDEGAVVIGNLRLYLSGTWTCIAMNPLGHVNMTTHVKIFSFIRTVHWKSMCWSGAVAFIALALGIIIGFVRYGVVRYREHSFRIQMIKENRHNESIVASQCASPRSGSKRNSLLSKSSSDEENYDGDNDDDYDDLSAPNIKDTLEDMGLRMRTNMKRNAEKMRNQMSTLKESTNMVVQKLHSSSSSAASRVKVGVQLSVEQMRNQVQSLKELCGKSDLCSAMPSTISVSTYATSHQDGLDRDLEMITEDPIDERDEIANNSGSDTAVTYEKEQQDFKNDDDDLKKDADSQEEVEEGQAVPLLQQMDDAKASKDNEDEGARDSTAEEESMTVNC